MKDGRYTIGGQRKKRSMAMILILGILRAFEYVVPVDVEVA